MSSHPRGPVAVPPASNTPPSGIVHDPYHPDRVRAYLGYSLIALLTLVIAFLMLQSVRGYLDTREFAEIVFPAALALAGTAAGFYFSEKARDE